jgi:voltage-gated potassium channel
MASEMVRPTAVSFLDVMLRDRDRNLRVEEFSVPESFAGQPLLALNLKKFTSSLLLAIKTGQDWVYNPPENHPIDRNSTLVVMTTPEERDELARFLKK